jgi:hypothetical protein
MKAIARTYASVAKSMEFTWCQLMASSYINLALVHVGLRRQDMPPATHMATVLPVPEVRCIRQLRSTTDATCWPTERLVDHGANSGGQRRLDDEVDDGDDMQLW